MAQHQSNQLQSALRVVPGKGCQRQQKNLMTKGKQFNMWEKNAKTKRKQSDGREKNFNEADKNSIYEVGGNTRKPRASQAEPHRKLVRMRFYSDLQSKPSHESGGMQEKIKIRGASPGMCVNVDGHHEIREPMGANKMRGDCPGVCVNVDVHHENREPVLAVLREPVMREEHRASCDRQSIVSCDQ